MVLDGLIEGVTELITGLPVDVSKNIADIVLLLKAVGIAAIFYVIYVIAMGIFTYRRMKKVGDIEEKTDAIEKKIGAIDKKLDRLLKKK